MSCQKLVGLNQACGYTGLIAVNLYYRMGSQCRSKELNIASSDSAGFKMCWMVTKHLFSVCVCVCVCVLPQSDVPGPGECICLSLVPSPGK